MINAWFNCLNWSQPNERMTRLVTPFINYVDLQRPDALNITNPVACKRFIERLKKFKYMDWKAIDPTCLEDIMTPALIGDPGFHYVCFVVNLKSQKFQFLNSLKGETLNMKNGEATVYKKMFDVWLKEVEAFVTELYKKRKITMPFQFSTFKWETPKMPNQCDKDSCEVFCMKFLAEWDGGNTEMESFKD
ncbi:putative Ulp1 protease family catalytic domain-containing protein [Medicago truncatula]|uniref:Putative Ulp1 protease family catalytic domain-containing protein n=1 Tax=Medicago truncatula TaxID=3880 RepID=A0A396GPY8_MEDTR|nr:putative Ulp1 protease family catalytic domain-containing protein [Medicago truncatula]